MSSFKFSVILFVISVYSSVTLAGEYIPKKFYLASTECGNIMVTIPSENNSIIYTTSTSVPSVICDVNGKQAGCKLIVLTPEQPNDYFSMVMDITVMYNSSKVFLSSNDGMTNTIYVDFIKKTAVITSIITHGDKLAVKVCKARHFSEEEANNTLIKTDS